MQVWPGNNYEIRLGGIDFDPTGNNHFFRFFLFFRYLGRHNNHFGHFFLERFPGFLYCRQHTLVSTGFGNYRSVVNNFDGNHRLRIVIFDAMVGVEINWSRFG